MKFKEFVDWCNERACDGLWARSEAEFCIEIIAHVRSVSRFKRIREKEWKRYNTAYNIDSMVDKMNERIKNLMSKKIKSIKVLVRYKGEFEADLEGFDKDFVDLKGLAEDSAKRDLAERLKSGDLTADDFTFNAVGYYE